MATVFYGICVYKDEEIPGTIPRNSTIPEELGRIQFLLTDKTGTLTQNDMIFKKLAMEYAQFDEEGLEDIKKFVLSNCKKYQGPMADVVDGMEIGNVSARSRLSDKSKRKQKKRRE